MLDGDLRLRICGAKGGQGSEKISARNAAVRVRVTCSLVSEFHSVDVLERLTNWVKLGERDFVFRCVLLFGPFFFFFLVRKELRERRISFVEKVLGDLWWKEWILREAIRGR